MVFFTYSQIEWGNYIDCHLKYDIGPYKKGEYIQSICRYKGTNTYTLYSHINWWSEKAYVVTLTRFMRANAFARRIQRAWRRCISDPEYNICKKRLMKEYREEKVETIIIKKEEPSDDWLKHIYNFDFDLNDLLYPKCESYRKHIKDAKNSMRYYQYQEFDEDDEEEFACPIGKRNFFCS